MTSIEEICKTFDVLGTSKISRGTVHQVLSAAGINATDSEVRTALGDEATASQVDISTVKQVYEKLKVTCPSSDELTKLLLTLDTAKKGVVNIDSLKFMLQHYGEKFERHDTEVLCKLLGANEGMKELSIQNVVDTLMKLQK